MLIYEHVYSIYFLFLIFFIHKVLIKSLILSLIKEMFLAIGGDICGRENYRYIT